jgi:hypothetical protein
MRYLFHSFPKFLILFFTSCVPTFPLLAQTPKIDSLNRQLDLVQADTTKVQLLNELAYEFWSKAPDKTLTFAEQALELSKKIKYVNGEARSSQMMGVYYWQKSDYPECPFLVQQRAEII